MLRHDTRHDGGKGGGGACDLHPAAAEEGDQEARDNGGVDALLRADAAGQRQRDGKGQRDDGYDDARYRVLGELLAGIGLQAVKQRGGEYFLMHKVPLSSFFAATRPYHRSAFKGAGMAFFQACIMYYVTSLMGLAETYSVLILAISIAGSLLMYPLANKFAKKRGKKLPIILGCTVFSAA